MCSVGVGLFFRRFWGRVWVRLHAEILDGNVDFLSFREPVLEVSAVNDGYPRAAGFAQFRRAVNAAQKAMRCLI